MFLVGTAIGFVLGARAGQERYEEIKRIAVSASESKPAQEAIAFAQRSSDAVADQLGRLSGRVSESSREFPAKVVHTAESLREDLRRRADELSVSIDDARSSAKEWVGQAKERVDQVKERNLEFQAQNVMAMSDLRNDALAEIEDGDDEMVDEGHADDRNLRE